MDATSIMKIAATNTCVAPEVLHIGSWQFTKVHAKERLPFRKAEWTRDHQAQQDGKKGEDKNACNNKGVSTPMLAQLFHISSRGAMRRGCGRGTHWPAMYQKMAKKKKTTRYTMKIPVTMYRSLVLRAEMKKSAAESHPVSVRLQAGGQSLTDLVLVYFNRHFKGPLLFCHRSLWCIAHGVMLCS